MLYKNPLPWDYDMDVGIRYEDLEDINIEDLFKEFNKRGIRIEYRPYAGIYKLWKGTITGDIIIFRDYYNNGIMRRIGIESWLLFGHYRYYQQFPKRLVEKPLPLMTFAGFNYSVPREGIEIQKYLYPRNWWKEIVPPDCHVNKYKDK